MPYKPLRQIQNEPSYIGEKNTLPVIDWSEDIPTKKY